MTTSGVARRRAVLLVDDRPENLLALEALLVRWATSSFVPDSGQEALDALEGDEFALILLDIRMPSMDGLETAARLRGLSAGRTPIIFVTADGAAPYSRRAYSRAADILREEAVDPPGAPGEDRVFHRALQARAAHPGGRRGVDHARRKEFVRSRRRRTVVASAGSSEPLCGRRRLAAGGALDRRDALIAIAPGLL